MRLIQSTEAKSHEIQQNIISWSGRLTRLVWRITKGSIHGTFDHISSPPRIQSFEQNITSWSGITPVQFQTQNKQGINHNSKKMQKNTTDRFRQSSTERYTFGHERAHCFLEAEAGWKLSWNCQ